MDGTDVEIAVVAGLGILTESSLDLVDSSVGVCDAGDPTRRIADCVDGTQKLRNNDARLAASRASG